MATLQINNYDFFLHTWSLAVEIQFYLITPVLVKLFSVPFGRKIFCCIAFIAPVYCNFVTSIIFQFFSLPIRIWQLMSGINSDQLPHLEGLVPRRFAKLLFILSVLCSLEIGPRTAAACPSAWESLLRTNSKRFRAQQRKIAFFGRFLIITGSLLPSVFERSTLPFDHNCCSASPEHFTDEYIYNREFNTTENLLMNTFLVTAFFILWEKCLTLSIFFTLQSYYLQNIILNTA